LPLTAIIAELSQSTCFSDTFCSLVAYCRSHRRSIHVGEGILTDVCKYHAQSQLAHDVLPPRNESTEFVSQLPPQCEFMCWPQHARNISQRISSAKFMTSQYWLSRFAAHLRMPFRCHSAHRRMRRSTQLQNRPCRFRARAFVLRANRRHTRSRLAMNMYRYPQIGSKRTPLRT